MRLGLPGHGAGSLRGWSCFWVSDTCLTVDQFGGSPLRPPAVVYFLLEARPLPQTHPSKPILLVLFKAPRLLNWGLFIPFGPDRLSINII